MFTLLFLVFFSSCQSGRGEYVERIKALKQQPIVLQTDSMLSLSYDQSKLKSQKEFDYKLVVFSDSTECTPCLLKELHKWNAFDKAAKLRNKKFSIYFIFNPQDNDDGVLYLSLRGYVMRDQMFFDTSRIFLRSNPNIPSEKVFHTFLLDKDNNVIVVGNPIENEKIKELIFKKISE